MPDKSEEVKVTYCHQLTPAVYADLEKKLSRNNMVVPTNAVEAAYHLGIQHALAAIRNGVVSK